MQPAGACLPLQGGSPSARHTRSPHTAATRRSLDSRRPVVLHRGAVSESPDGQVPARRRGALRLSEMARGRPRPLLGGGAALLHRTPCRHASRPADAGRHGGDSSVHRHLQPDRVVFVRRRRRLLPLGIRRRLHPAPHGRGGDGPCRHGPLEAGDRTRARQSGRDSVDVPGRAGDDFGSPFRRVAAACGQPSRGSGPGNDGLDSMGMGLAPPLRRQRLAGLLGGAARRDGGRPSAFRGGSGRG